jgi:hypothetical protein
VSWSSCARRLKNLQETQRARSRFLGAASHDLRQPVQALLFLSDIFRKSTDPARRDAMAQQIMRTAQSIDGMFRHLVDFAQIDAGTMKAVVQPVQLERLLAAACSGFAEKCAARGLGFRLEIAGPATWSADPVLLERMLRNFLDNAFKYSLQGEIVVRADCTGAGGLAHDLGPGRGHGARRPGAGLQCLLPGPLRREDRGRGHRPGPGDLAAHGGPDADRAGDGLAAGQGTRVTMHLPLAQEAGARGPAAAAHGGAPLKGLLVAVVENDRLARDALAPWLQEAGARVAAGGTLAEAAAGPAGRAREARFPAGGLPARRGLRPRRRGGAARALRPGAGPDPFRGSRHRRARAAAAGAAEARRAGPAARNYAGHAGARAGAGPASGGVTVTGAPRCRDF